MAAMSDRRSRSFDSRCRNGMRSVDDYACRRQHALRRMHAEGRNGACRRSRRSQRPRQSVGQARERAHRASRRHGAELVDALDRAGFVAAELAPTTRCRYGRARPIRIFFAASASRGSRRPTSCCCRSRCGQVAAGTCRPRCNRCSTGSRR